MRVGCPPLATMASNMKANETAASRYNMDICNPPFTLCQDRQGSNIGKGAATGGAGRGAGAGAAYRQRRRDGGRGKQPSTLVPQVNILPPLK